MDIPSNPTNPGQPPVVSPVVGLVAPPQVTVPLTASCWGGCHIHSNRVAATYVAPFECRQYPSTQHAAFRGASKGNDGPGRHPAGGGAAVSLGVGTCCLFLISTFKMGCSPVLGGKPLMWEVWQSSSTGRACQSLPSRFPSTRTMGRSVGASKAGCRCAQNMMRGPSLALGRGARC